MKGKGYLKSYRYAGTTNVFPRPINRQFLPFRIDTDRLFVSLPSLPSKPSYSSRYSRQMPPGRAPLRSMMKQRLSQRHQASISRRATLFFFCSLRVRSRTLTIASRIGLASGAQRACSTQPEQNCTYIRLYGLDSLEPSSSQYPTLTTCLNYNRTNCFVPQQVRGTNEIKRKKEKKKDSAGSE